MFKSNSEEVGDEFVVSGFVSLGVGGTILSLGCFIPPFFDCVVLFIYLKDIYFRMEIAGVKLTL